MLCCWQHKTMHIFYVNDQYHICVSVDSSLHDSLWWLIACMLCQSQTFSPCLSPVGATIREGLQERGKESEIIEHLTFFLLIGIFTVKWNHDSLLSQLFQLYSRWCRTWIPQWNKYSEKSLRLIFSDQILPPRSSFKQRCYFLFYLDALFRFHKKINFLPKAWCRNKTVSLFWGYG